MAEYDATVADTAHGVGGVGYQEDGAALLLELLDPVDALALEPFVADGGFARLNKVFGGELENVLAGINEEMWKKAG